MKKLLLILISSVFLLSYEEVIITNIDLNNKKADINSYVEKGITGVVICPYQNEEIICARAMSLGKKIILLPYEELKNDSFAKPIIFPKKMDKVIFKKDYDRIAILAPNQKIYLEITNRYKNKKIIISSDIIAALMNNNSFDEIAKKLNIGLYILVLKNYLYLIDAKSLYVIKKERFPGVNSKTFFTYYKNFDIKLNYKSIFKGL